MTVRHLISSNLGGWGTLPSVVLQRVGRHLSTTTVTDKSKGLLQYAPTASKAYIKVRGPDAPKFLNGLVTSKLLPFFIKKNLTTINPLEEEETSKAVPEFNETEGNWGLYNELSYNGSYISRFGMYTGILNSKGKLLSDTIIYPTPLTSGKNSKIMKYPTYLLEFDDATSDSMLNTLMLHKLTSKVKIKKFGSLKSWDIRIQLPNVPKDAHNPWIINLLDPCTMAKTPIDALNYAAGVVSTLFHGREDQILAMYIERRTDEMLEADGSAPQLFRVVSDESVEDISCLFNPMGFPFDFEMQKVDPQFFRKLRFEAGYVDSTTDYKPESLLPLELNFDFLPNAVSADKGCYVGQELTARTFATGILRKRLVPVILTNSNELPNGPGDKYYEIQLKDENIDGGSLHATSTYFGNSKDNNLSTIPIRSRRQRPAGTLIAHEQDRGVALLRIEHFHKAFEHSGDEFFCIPSNANENRRLIVGVKPQRPYWLQARDGE